MLLVMLGVVFGVYKYKTEIGETNIIKVYSGENKIYEGKKAFVDIESGGMTTTITIYKSLFPFLVKEKVYSNVNIRIE
jgi:hypothetical protein